jgi:hypothetical protein
MLVVQNIDQPRSVQTWYECTTCGGQRLVSTEKSRSLLGGGLSLASAPRPSTPRGMGF